MTIEDDSRYRLEVAVEESQLGKVSMGQQTRVRIDAFGADDLEGGVSEITPAADPMSRSYMVKIDLPSRQGLRSGLYGVARFVSGRKQAIVVPRLEVDIAHRRRLDPAPPGSGGDAAARGRAADRRADDRCFRAEIIPPFLGVEAVRRSGLGIAPKQSIPAETARSNRDDAAARER